MEISQFSLSLGDQEIASVLETLRDNWLTAGPKTQELQRRLADHTGAKHVLMVPNGTLALFVALKVWALGLATKFWCPTLRSSAAHRRSF